MNVYTDSVALRVCVHDKVCSRKHVCACVSVVCVVCVLYRLPLLSQNTQAHLNAVRPDWLICATRASTLGSVRALGRERSVQLAPPAPGPAPLRDVTCVPVVLDGSEEPAIVPWRTAPLLDPALSADACPLSRVCTPRTGAAAAAAARTSDSTSRCAARRLSIGTTAARPRGSCNARESRGGSPTSVRAVGNGATRDIVPDYVAAQRS